MSTHRNRTKRAYPGGPTRADIGTLLAVMAEVGLLQSELIDGKLHYRGTELLSALPEQAQRELIDQVYRSKGPNWQS